LHLFFSISFQQNLMKKPILINDRMGNKAKKKKRIKGISSRLLKCTKVKPMSSILLMKKVVMALSQ